MQASFGLSERRACSLVGVDRSTCRYQGRHADWSALRERLRVLAAERRRFGYRRLPVLLRREGYRVNLARKDLSPIQSSRPRPRPSPPFTVANDR